jgi:hypothetical protein
MDKKLSNISLPPFISIARGIMGALFRKEEKTEA